MEDIKIIRQMGKTLSLSDILKVYELTFIEIDRFGYPCVNKSIYKERVDINKFPKVQANLKYQKGIKKYKR